MSLVVLQSLTHFTFCENECILEEILHANDYYLFESKNDDDYVIVCKCPYTKVEMSENLIKENKKRNISENLFNDLSKSYETLHSSLVVHKITQLIYIQ